jgi:putative spermidine/putrescine transport system substrate-binding protein
MKRSRLTLVSLIVILTLLLAACAPAAAPAATSAPASTSAPGATSAPAATAPAQVTTINFISDSDTNITDWMSNKIAPLFHAKFPQYQLKVTIVRGVGNGDADIADRAYAALQTNSDPQVDILEFDATTKPNLVTAGLWQTLDATTVPNAKDILKGIQTSNFSMPYRGSQVLLAYDSTKLKDSDVPKTFADLITWIKANPGQFVYCRPDKGGSGGNFVDRAIYEVTGKDPSIFKPGTPDPTLTAKFADAWTLLRSIHTSIYDNGAYPAGNTQSLTLLANGSVTMISAWSDQSLAALAAGTLPPTVHLAQLTDVPFPGGSTMLSIPKNAKNLQGALAFLNFMLSSDGQVSVIKEIGGFPAVDWSVLPKDLQTQYTSVIAKSVPNWPGGDWDAIKNKGWYDNVATNIKQGS